MKYQKTLLSTFFIHFTLTYGFAQSEDIILTTYDKTEVTARRSITLRPGFEVTNGQTFHARVGNQYFDDQLNWKRAISYSVDEQGNSIEIGDTKVYFDGMGKTLQTQSKSFENDDIFASQPVYDRLGNPVLNTLSAPLRSNVFGYEPYFITNSSGSPYHYNDFDKPVNTGAAGEIDNPNPLGDTETGTLGWYYSQNNTIEPQTPVTDFPYARSWSETGPDPRYSKAAGPGEAHKMGSGHETESEKIPWSAGELSHYYSLRHYFTSTTTAIDQDKGYKLISTDPNDKRVYSYMDASGKILVVGIKGNTPGVIEEYSYNYYNDVGQLVASVAPNGVDVGSTTYPNFVTTYEYDHRGLLISTSRPDEGTSTFKYSTDGKLRFSQNSKQLNDGANNFSYTDYDHLGRALEYGQYIGSILFESSASLVDNIGHNSWPDTDKKDVTKIFYDLPAPDYPSDPDHPKQSFLYGQISRTENESTKTWYSYDEFGRLEWMKQEIYGLGIKTVDYTYDFTGNVLEVAYQKGQADAFYHHYEYDKDQRLVNAYTSKDGFNKTSQASYEYYYHGPLKRVELGENIQGIDYVYTITGGLKGINNADDDLDPGHDGIAGANSGFGKDVFGMTMQYYANDYQGAGYSAGTQALTGYNDQFGGALKAVSWHNATDNNLQPRTYAYQYDHKYQLKQADWGDMTGSEGTYGFSLSPAHEVDIPSYDKNGNINYLNRKDDQGNVLAAYDYAYATNNNQLTQVNHNGAPLASFTYNEIGELETKTEDGNTYFYEFDGYGNLTAVRENSATGLKLVSYEYDDRGFRVRRIAYDDTGNERAYTWYVRDAGGNEMSVYYEEVGQTPVQTEIPIYGGSRLAVYKPQQQITFYEIGDHQGNVRAVIGQPEVQLYSATMEDSHFIEEQADFSPSYDEVTVVDTEVHNHTQETGASKSIRLTGLEGEIVGLAKSLKVSPGDIIDMKAWVKATNVTSTTPSDVMGFLGAGFTTAMGISSTGETAELYSFFRDLFSAGSLFSDPNGTSTPNGYLNFLLFDENYNLENLGYKPVSLCSGTGCVYEELSLQVEVEKAGYLYIYVSNESEKVSEVFFDDFEITHHQSPVVFGHDYYPFGLPMAGRQITDEEYRFDYQGQFAEKDSVTGFNSFALRQYDARFGRWMSTDPYGQYASPYVGMGNMPHIGVDPDGGFNVGATLVGATAGFAIGSLVGLAADKDNWWKYGIAGAVVGGVIGASHGDIDVSENADFLTKTRAEIEQVFTTRGNVYRGRNRFDFGPPPQSLWIDPYMQGFLDRTHVPRIIARIPATLESNYNLRRPDLKRVAIPSGPRLRYQTFTETLGCRSCSVDNPSYAAFGTNGLMRMIQLARQGGRQIYNIAFGTDAPDSGIRVRTIQGIRNNLIRRGIEPDLFTPVVYPITSPNSIQIRIRTFIRRP